MFIKYIFFWFYLTIFCISSHVVYSKHPPVIRSKIRSNNYTYRYHLPVKQLNSYNYSNHPPVNGFTPFILERWNGVREKQILVVIVTNDSYEQYLASWVKQLKSFKDYNYIIELSEPSQQCQSRCLQYNLTCTKIISDLYISVINTGRLPYKIAVKKPMVAHKILELGYDVLFADIDVFWNKDLVAIAHKHAINNGNDLVASTLFTSPYLCSGLYFMRSNTKTIQFSREWFNLVKNHPRVACDQQFLNANLGVYDYSKTTPSSTNLSWSFISNQSFSLHEADLEYEDVFAACKDYSSSNNLLASIHITNPIGGVVGRHICMKELYAGFFPQLMGCKKHIPDDNYPQLKCFLYERYLTYKTRNETQLINSKKKFYNPLQSILRWNKVHNRVYGTNGFIL